MKLRYSILITVVAILVSVMVVTANAEKFSGPQEVPKARVIVAASGSVTVHGAVVTAISEKGITVKTDTDTRKATWSLVYRPSAQAEQLTKLLRVNDAGVPLTSTQVFFEGVEVGDIIGFSGNALQVNGMPFVHSKVEDNATYEISVRSLDQEGDKKDDVPVQKKRTIQRSIKPSVKKEVATTSVESVSDNPVEIATTSDAVATSSENSAPTTDQGEVSTASSTETTAASDTGDISTSTESQ